MPSDRSSLEIKLNSSLAFDSTLSRATSYKNVDCSVNSSLPCEVGCKFHSCDTKCMCDCIQFTCGIPRSGNLILSTDNSHSNMSPNPENINFLNVVQQHDQEQDFEEDSGFASGGKINSCRQDHETLISNEEQLMICGFYHPELDSIRAMKLLKKSSVGTFLIRNSSDSRYLFSLSVKTQRGVTSVRIIYHEGWFLFDCDDRIRRKMPRFRSVLSLVDHHVDLSKKGTNNSWRWEEKSGRKNMVVDISNPCRTSVLSLKQLSTIEVNKLGDQSYFQIFSMSPSIRDRLLKCTREYPYRI